MCFNFINLFYLTDEDEDGDDGGEEADEYDVDEKKADEKGTEFIYTFEAVITDYFQY